MTSSRTTSYVWASTACALAAGALLWFRAIPRAQVHGSGVSNDRVTLAKADLTPPEDLATRSSIIVAADLFRLDRMPAGVPFGATPEPVAAAMPQRSSTRLTVSGIIGGPPWDVLLDGVPGRQAGVIVRQGDTLGGLRVVRVTRDSVLVRDRDSTWHLTLKEDWR